MRILLLILLEVFLFCIFLLLVSGNFLMGLGALECASRMYDYSHSGVGAGLHYAFLMFFSIPVVLIYSIFHYGIYRKYRGRKFFYIALISFVIIFFSLCIEFPTYRQATFSMYSVMFGLMCMEIVALYRLRNKCLEKITILTNRTLVRREESETKRVSCHRAE